MDFAKRAYDHSYRIDPIVRSLLDTDFYKLLMLQFIWKHYYNTRVVFGLTNRKTSVRLAEIVDETELRAQLDHVRTLRFTKSELIWLRGQTFYGQTGLFEDPFVDFLRTFELPPYTLEKKDGQFVLEFSGTWKEATMWEIYALAIVNELRYRAVMKDMPKADLDIMYARAKVKLRDKLNILNELEGLNLTDFGTRRRHSFLWQEYCVETAKSVLGNKFTGTSNAYLAMKHDLEAKGTNAHELPMVMAALANGDEELKESQYNVLREWQNTYRGGLLVMLPDTFGTTQFLENMPPVMAMAWTGARPDSKPAIEGGEELVRFWERADGAHVKDKLIIFSDGMDVQLPHYAKQGTDIPTVHKHFKDRVRVGFGWGSLLTNDFIGCHPTDPTAMNPISLVCKVKEADGRPAVKLSDQPTKATGDKEEVERYKRVFGVEGADTAKEPLV